MTLKLGQLSIGLQKLSIAKNLAGEVEPDTLVSLSLLKNIFNANVLELLGLRQTNIKFFVTAKRNTQIEGVFI